MEIIDLEMIPGGPKKTCHASQFDNGRVIRFNLKENGQPFALSGTETVQAIIRKPDGSETTLDIANTSSTYVDLITEADTCDLAGVNHCEMKVTEDGEDLGSGNFDMKVEEDAYGAGDVTVGEASGAIASFETDIKDDLIECVCEINPVQDLHGYDHPWPAGGGKNLLDYSKWEGVTITRGTAVWENNGVTITATERDAYTQYVPPYLTPFIEINPGDSIWVSWQESTNTEGQAMVFTSRNGAWGLRAFTNNSKSKSLHYTVTDEDEGFLSFRFGVLNQGDVISYKNIQIEKGSSATPYEPYENVCPIEGHTEMDIIRSGVNLWDGVYPNIDNSVRYKAIKVPNGTYTMSTSAPLVEGAALLFFLAGNVQSGASTATNGVYGNVTRTVTTTDGYITVAYRLYGTPTVNPSDYDTQIELGNTATAYHPAEIIEKTIQLGQTVYRARINITTGQGIIDQAGIDLGSLTWEKEPTVTGKWRFVADITNVKRTENVRAIPDAICTKYVPVSPLDTWNGINGFTIDWESDRSFICDLNIEDATAFNNAMNGILMVYELKNPVSIQLTPEQIETLLGQKNNVYHNANGNTAVKFYTRA